MTSGPGRPGQPMPGQRSIFGTGRGPVFAQMPAYKPVTRGSEPQPQAPEPPRPDYGAYARQGVEPQAPQMPGVSGYANQNGAAPSYQTPSAPPRSYDHSGLPQSLPTPADLSAPAAELSAAAAAELPAAAAELPAAAATDRYPGQSYQPQPPQYPGQSYQPQPQAQPSRPAPSQASPIPAQPSYQPEPSPSHSFQDAGFPDRIFPAEATQHAGHAEQGYDDTNYAQRELSATHPSKMRASLTPPSRTQVSPRRRPSRITPKRPRIMTPLARMTPCISTMLPLPTAPNPIRSRSPINQGTIIRPGTIIWRRRACHAVGRPRVLCRRIRPCKPSMPATNSRRRSRLAARNIQTRCRRRTRLRTSMRATRATPTSSMKASS